MNDIKNKKAKDLILVVDDQPNNLKLIANVLGQEYSLSIANSGINALKMLENGVPDLILLDVMMPEMDGFEVCKKIKENENTKNIPIIFLTAKSDIDDIVKGFDYGAVDYITKPFNLIEMKVRIKNHLSLYHAKQEIEQINMEKDKFFSIIAHDLRGPFSSIVSFSELLSERIKENKLERIGDYAERIFKASQKSINLLTNLMTWARSKTGRMEFNPETLNLTELINENIMLFSELAVQKSISLKYSTSDDIKVFADKDMLSAILRNLISNAVKFNFPEGEINVTSEAIADGVIISVNDNGMGMSDNLKDDLFKINKKTGRIGSAGELSSGLGLILCKELIEKHGGEIWVESEEGKGSVFYVKIPNQ